MSDFDIVLYWKTRMSNKLASIKRQVEFDLNDIAKQADHIELERTDILEKMQFVVIALTKLDKAILQAKQVKKKV